MAAQGGNTVRFGTAFLIGGILCIGLAFSTYGAACWIMRGSLSTCPLTDSEYLVQASLDAAGILSLGLGTGLLLTEVVRRWRTRMPESTRAKDHSPGAGSLSKHTRWSITLGCAAIAVATLVVLVVVPVPQHFTLHEVAIYDLQRSCPGIDTAQGTPVNFHWSAPSPIFFFALSCSANQVAYEGNGTSGSGSFVSVGGVYEFGASCGGPYPCVAANVSGSYAAPLLSF